MSEIKPIKTKEDYSEALVLLESLIVLDPTEGSEESDQIMVLAALIEDYESATFPDHLADPIEAIRFRMEQLGLKSIDLVPYLGSKSRVSEILSGKRSLTVKMIKNLEEGLGIPASSLIGSIGANAAKRWTPKVIESMAVRGYFGSKHIKSKAGEIIGDGILKSFLSSISPTLQPALLRQTNYRDASSVDTQLLNAWLVKVSGDADITIKRESVPAFNSNEPIKDWVSDLVAISAEQGSPSRAIDFLKTKGIVVEIEPSLPSTRLDGATLFTDTHVIIGLTIRHDRLDNFWFTLLHEIAHAALHRNPDDVYFDNLDSSTDLVDAKEKEADMFAKNTMISEDVWSRSPIRRNATPMIIAAFAKKLGINEAIVAGRLRYESGQWNRYGDIVNGHPVRQYFGEKIW